MPRYRIDRPGDFGGLLAGLREDAGISQEAFADQLGFARSYLSEMEAGKSTVQLMRLIRALHALGADIEVSWNSPTRRGDDHG